MVGAVNDQSSFLYKPGPAGCGAICTWPVGSPEDADRKRSFVIRADGEVVGYESRKGLWGNQFLDLPIFPGDTIVFPEKTFKPSAMRSVLDWSQMFSQFALGAASLSVIHSRLGLRQR